MVKYDIVCFGMELDFTQGFFIVQLGTIWYSMVLDSTLLYRARYYSIVLYSTLEYYIVL